MVPSVSEEYDWHIWVREFLISQTTSSNNTIHFCDFHRESMEYRMWCLTIVHKTFHYLMTSFATSCLQCSVTWCHVNRFGSNHLHKLTHGRSSYILRTGSGWMDRCDVYGVTRRVPMTMSLVRGCSYCGVCRCSAVPTLVREGGVGLSFYNSDS